VSYLSKNVKKILALLNYLATIELAETYNLHQTNFYKAMRYDESTPVTYGK